MQRILLCSLAVFSLSITPMDLLSKRLAKESDVAAEARAGLAARNAAFLDAAEVFDVDSMLSFFSRSNDFTYTFTFHHRNGDSIAVWRFPAAEAKRAIEGPLRARLDDDGEFLGIGTFASALAFTLSDWRRVGESRFVPPRADAASGTYVEWRREGSQWVVAAFGDEGFEEGMEPAWLR